MENKLPQVLEINKEGWERVNQDMLGLVFTKTHKKRFFVKIAHHRYWPSLYKTLLDLKSIITAFDNEEEIVYE